jgi:hypothetical protein
MRPTKYIIRVGDQYNRYTVLSEAGKDSRNRKRFLCRCSCGIEKVVLGPALFSGGTKSCGCFGSEKRKATRLPDNRGVITQILLGYKRHARDRELCFDLTFDEFSILVQQPCYYCNIPSSNIKTTKAFKEGFPYNGIDRVDSSIGYITANVVTCCKSCNLAKRDTNKDVFISWVAKTYRHLKDIGQINDNTCETQTG